MVGGANVVMTGPVVVGADVVAGAAVVAGGAVVARGMRVCSTALFNLTSCAHCTAFWAACSAQPMPMSVVTAGTEATGDTAV